MGRLGFQVLTKVLLASGIMIINFIFLALDSADVLTASVLWEEKKIIILPERPSETKLACGVLPVIEHLHLIFNAKAHITRCKGAYDGM